MASRKAVFVNGYGSIGRRIAAFLAEDDEIEITGVGKHTPDAGVAEAAARGLRVYAPRDRLDRFAGSGVAGAIEDAVRDSDLVIDASPGGQGVRNKRSLYGPLRTPAIYQGGETVRGPDAVSDILFNSRVNYDEAAGRDHVMQGSCNVTGIGRVIEPLRARYGARIERFDVTLVRRWADIEQSEKGLVDTIEMSQSPHHGDDVRSYMGEETPLFLRAIKVPSRQMHLHIMDVRFAAGSGAPRPSEFLAALAGEPGVATLWTAGGTADVRRFADEMGFSFADTNMIHVHANMTATVGDTVQTMYSDDQTGIVIPENHMLAQAMLFGRPYEEARRRTDSLFRMPEKKRRLEERFALPAGGRGGGGGKGAA